MLNTLNVDLKTDIKNDRPTALGIKLMSQDKNNNQFILRFTNGGEPVNLDHTYTVEILTKFSNSGASRLTSATVRQDYATWEFDTAYITQDERVTNYVYVRKAGNLVVSADANAFYFDVGLSEIDKDAGRVAEVYDENYQKYLDEFKDNVDFEEIAQAESDRQANEDIRQANELLREENYNQKVDTAIVEADVVEKVDNKVTELTPQINDLTAQLAQKADKGNVSVSDINKNLGKLDQTYMSDEFLQQMAGNTPINAVPAPRSIAETQMAVPIITGFFSKNLFDKRKAKPNTVITSGNGVESALDGFYTSDFIYVIAGTTYTKYSNRPYAWYDSELNYISGSGTGLIITAPSNAYYLKYVVRADELEREQLEIGNSATTYEQYGSKFDMEMLKERIERKHLTFDPVGYVTGKNLFNKDTVTPDSHISYLNGNVVPLSGFTASDFIPVKPMTDYTMKHAQQMAFYNADKSFISGLATQTLLTTPEDAVFIRVTTKNNNLETQQIEEGTVSTSYEPFRLYLDPRINVKNDSIVSEGNDIQHNNSVVCIGDSITRGQSDVRRYPTWLETVPGIGRVYNKGVSGSGIEHAINNIDWVFDMTPLPSTAVILYGTNNTSESVESIVKKYNSLVKIVVSKGIEPVLCTLIPRSDNVTRNEKVIVFNNWLRDYAKQNGYILADTFLAFANSDGTPKEGYLNADNLHPETLGYRELVKTIADVLPNLAPEQHWTTPMDGNIIINPTFTGDANVDGVASGWTLSIPTGATATATIIDHPDAGNWQQIKKDGGSDPNTLTSVNQTIAHSFTGGATYLIEADMESDELINSDYTVLGQFRSSDNSFLGGIGASPRIDVTSSERRWRGYATAPSGAESIKIFLAVYGDGKATVRFGRVTVRKVETFNLE